MQKQPTHQTKKQRIGILIDRFQNANLPAIEYLLLHLNTLQITFEYEFLPIDDENEFIQSFRTKKPVDRNITMGRIGKFIESYERKLKEWMDEYELKDKTPPDYYILITNTHFSDGYYAIRQERLSILALGNWKTDMAPPSIVEFILTLVVGESVKSISPSLQNYMHFGTKSCLFDLTPFLEDARYRVLNAFICEKCRQSLRDDNLPNLADEVVLVLNKQWFGQTSDLSSPAGIASKFGYDLFVTKGLTANVWEKFSSVIKEEGVRQLISIVGTLIIALLLLWLGIK